MPVLEPKHIEFAIVSGHIVIALEDGSRFPAYWAHPNIGGQFPSIVLLHDWWGIRPLERRLAQALAQMGYYVIVPDLFDGKIAATPQEALKFVEALGTRGSLGVDAALQTMENNARSNRNIAVIGLGMGGSLAYEVALRRPDLEAVVSFYGFPQRFLGQFQNAQVPILAVYGSQEPYTKPVVIDRLRRELAAASAAHEVQIVSSVGRDFFEADTLAAGQAWRLMERFLEKHLKRARVRLRS